MPFYEYECDACGHQLEALQKISETPLRKCPHCGKAKLRRLISPPVFHLKGSGWYETDFKSDKEGKRNLAGHAEKEESGGAAQADAKTEAKPEEKKVESKAEAKTESKPESKPDAKGKRTSVAVNKASARRLAHKKRSRKR